MTEKMDQPTTTTFLAYLLAFYPQQRLLLVDHASWHKGMPVETLLAQHPRLELFYLPTACPDLNPQKHVWAAVRAAVTAATSFTHLVTNFLTTLHQTRFRSILFERNMPPILSSHLHLFDPSVLSQIEEIDLSR